MANPVTPPRSTMNMQSKPGVPRTPVAKAPPKQEPQYDVQKIDPAEVLNPQARAAPRPALADDLESNFERMPLPSEVAPPEEKERKVPTKQIPVPPRPPRVDPLKAAVPNSLIASLEEEFGLRPEETLVAELEVEGRKLEVSYRRINYDDLMFAVSQTRRTFTEEEDDLLDKYQNNQMYRHYITCRCVQKIRGEFVWDMLQRTEDIKKVIPSWDGTSSVQIPAVFINQMAVAVYDLFRRRLHPDLLLHLDRAVHGQDFRGTEPDDDEEENAEEQSPEDFTEAT